MGYESFTGGMADLVTLLVAAVPLRREGDITKAMDLGSYESKRLKDSLICELDGLLMTVTQR